ncbi:catechol 2,3-dioxygenase-like lactoylglutathione lyase family enzyme [Duganella sp. SG902]|uniref:VOC family protein n=1 Tax=Duganella sp. SG902 TaxID=2587016 RepID=UPI00159E06BF|nr:VOC family protein [Duganella sp. SG902]NVM75542.1 catechol 2,3-dioxygenase-like lactoylglutathione lyase family enzyme [Duganella sp. SG902]
MQHISAISLFVEDLPAARAFYLDVFGVPVEYEDANCTVVKFENVLVNLLQIAHAPEIVAPGAVAAREAGARFQLSIWVSDVQAVYERLKQRGIAINGPLDRPWGLRTINFTDPAGHSWEVGQQITA